MISLDPEDSISYNSSIGTPERHLPWKRNDHDEEGRKLSRALNTPIISTRGGKNGKVEM
jgi:hypothetical protein